MIRVRVWFSRTLDLILRRRRDARLSHEIREHIDLLIEENIARGLSPEDARLAARCAFGGVDQIRSRYRDQRGLPFMDSLTQDVRFAIRLLIRDRDFAATAILVLALGIGVNNLFFTLMYGFKLRGLPIDRPERVLYLSTFDDRVADRGVSLADFEDLRSSQQSFDGLAAYVTSVAAIGDQGRAPDRVDSAYITANAFELLGLRPLSGRTFTVEEERPGATPVAIVAASVWQQRYASEASILGRSILVDGFPFAVVGVMPDRAGFPSTATVWLPLGRWPAIAEQKRDTRTLRVFGRLRDGADEASAGGEIDTIVGRLESTYPETNRNIRARLVPINSRILGNLEGWTPFILAGLIIVAIACANVANLIIVRSLHRAPEIAVRTSLGASRMRVVRQLLIECGVLATFGGIAGLGVSIAGVQLFGSAIPEYIRAYWTDFTLDQRIFVALLVVSFATVFICGLVPALQASKTDVNRVLKDGGRVGQGQRTTRAWTMTFLTVEIALALVLLAQLGVQFVVASEELPTDRILRETSMMTATVTISAERYRTADQRIEFVRQIEEGFRGQPGVEATSVASFGPLAGSAARRLQIAGRETRDGSTLPTAGAVTIGANYFTTIGIPMARGREFDENDGLPGRVTAIVNQRFADVFLSGLDPIGTQIALTPPNLPSGTLPEWRTIVGVSPSIRQADTPDPTPIAYVPFRSTAPATMTFLVRSQIEASTLASILRQEAHSVDSHVPLYRMLTLNRAIEDATWNSRVSKRLAAGIILISIALATVGLYAVTAHGVALRTWEIGLRMALGARSLQVVALVLRSVRLPLILGLIIGTIGALAWDRAFAAGRGGVLIGDPRAIALIAMMMTVVVVLACFFPVRRATKLNAISALRQE